MSIDVDISTWPSARRMIEVDLDEDQKAALATSAEHVRSTVATLKALE